MANYASSARPPPDVVAATHADGRPFTMDLHPRHRSQLWTRRRPTRPPKLTDSHPVCLNCAGIPGDFTCKTCYGEGEIYRSGQCARCALREASARFCCTVPPTSPPCKR
jgi:hypothetical protein